MTPSTIKISPCVLCGKGMDSFVCSQNFCANHVNEHRQKLSKKMDEIRQEHDDLRQSLNAKLENLDSHVVMKEINDWEEKCIETIHQLAAESRKQLHDAVDRFKNKFIEILEPLAQELDISYKENIFVEADLNIWTTKLEKLKTELIAPLKIAMKRDYYGAPLITKICVIETPDDVFQESIGNIKIDNTGKVIKHGFWDSYETVRGRGEYSSGCYQFHFQIVNFDTNFVNGFFFGIISKRTLIKKNTPPAYTSCGWTGSIIDPSDSSHTCCLVGVNRGKYNNKANHKIPFRNIEKYDIFELLINCDQQKIRLVNTRTNEVDEITINLDEHPFPWQLNFSLYSSKQCVRLLTS